MWNLMWFFLTISLFNPPVNVVDAQTTTSYQEQLSELESVIFNATGGNRYSSIYLPIISKANTFNISMALQLTHIEEVNEQEETMSITVVLTQWWTDDYLVWSRQRFPKIEQWLRVDARRIWKPNFQFSNLAAGRLTPFSANDAWILNSYVRETNASRVVMKSTMSLKLSCDFDYSDYPFDKQRCPIILKLPFVSAKEKIQYIVGSNAQSRASMGWDPLRTASYESPDIIPKEPKMIVAGWHVTNVSGELDYWAWILPNGPYEQYKSLDEMPKDRTQLIYVFPYTIFWIEVKRFTGFYVTGVLLPLVLTALTTLLCLLIRSKVNSLLLLMLTLIVELLFLLEYIQLAPQANASLPGIVVFFRWNFAMTFVASILILLLDMMENVKVFSRPAEFTAKLSSSVLNHLQKSSLATSRQNSALASGNLDPLSDSNASKPEIAPVEKLNPSIAEAQQSQLQPAVKPEAASWSELGSLQLDSPISDEQAKKSLDDQNQLIFFISPKEGSLIDIDDKCQETQGSQGTATSKAPSSQPHERNAASDDPGEGKLDSKGQQERLTEVADQCKTTVFRRNIAKDFSLTIRCIIFIVYSLIYFALIVQYL